MKLLVNGCEISGKNWISMEKLAICTLNVINKNDLKCKK